MGEDSANLSLAGFLRAVRATLMAFATICCMRSVGAAARPLRLCVVIENLPYGVVVDAPLLLL